MTKQTTGPDEELRQLAVIGARARLKELDDAEARAVEKIESDRLRLYLMFPELAKKRRATPTGPAVLFDAEESKPAKASKKSKRGTPRKFSDADKERVLKDLRAGMILADAERKHGIAATVLRRWAKIAKVKIAKMSPSEAASQAAKSRGSGSAHPLAGRKRTTYDDKTKEAVLKRLRAGEYGPDVARATGISKSQIGRWAAAAKVKITLMPLKERGRRTSLVRTGKSTGPSSLRTPVKASTKAEAIERALSGESPKHIADDLGLVPSTVASWASVQRKANANGVHKEG